MNLFELRVSTDSESEGLQVALPGQQPMNLLPDPVLFEAHVASVKIVVDDGTPYLDLKFTDEGSQRLQALRDQYIGQKMAVLVEGRLMIAPVIQDTLDVDGLLLSVQRLPRSEMERIALLLTGS